MEVIYSDKNLLHRPKEVLSGGYIEAFECPERVVNIVETLKRKKGYEFIEPDESISYNETIAKVHDEDYLTYLRTIHARWKEKIGTDYIIPECFPHYFSKSQIKESTDDMTDVAALTGRYSSDLSTCITAGTWGSALSSAKCAIYGAKRLLESSSKKIFALCRPPGHHCESGLAAGYCYLNNAALATTYLLDNLQNTTERHHVSILDLDFHHGNGTQAIFYEMKNPAYISLHGKNEYPYYTGFVNETGKGEGEGYTKNYPLLKKTTDEQYLETLKKACNDVKNVFRSTHLVVSLGVDTYLKDPIGGFCLTSMIYEEMGKMIGRLRLPTLIVMEGGYHLDTIGPNVESFLRGVNAIL
jgi:acetoin utilization deacetylase AcuC-like enzyme